MRGAFLGLAVGDIVGAPVEGLTAREIRTRFGWVSQVLDPFEVWSEDLSRGRLRGLHTDDTQQAWLLSAALEGEFDTASVAGRYPALARPRPGLPGGLHRGTGRTFRAMLANLAAGRGPMEAGVASSSNGAAMRVAPIGVRHADDAERVVEIALLSGAMSHRDPRALEAAAAVASAVAAAIRTGGTLDRQACLAAARQGAIRAEQQLAAGRPVALDPAVARHRGAFARVLDAVASGDTGDPAATLAHVARHARECEPEREIQSGTESFSLASVTSAIVIAAIAGSFREAVEVLVNAGGDTDTTAAIAGAIAGARFGEPAIPREWHAALVGRESLEQVASALAGEAVEWPDQESLEEAWTRRELEERLRRRRSAR